MQSTKTSQIYALIIANPGITAREITKSLKTKNVSRIIYALQSRGMVKGVEGDGPRSTRYYKGRAPAVLRQPAGMTQKRIDAAAAETEQSRQIQYHISALQEILKQTTAQARYSLSA